MKLINLPLNKGSVKENEHLYRLGLTDFPKVQIDTLSFIPLSQKVLSILNGNPNFTAEELESDYDDPESDQFDFSKEDEIDVFPIDEYSDKVDVIDVQKSYADKAEKFKKAVETTVIDETKDSNNTTTESTTNGSSTTEEKKN